MQKAILSFALLFLLSKAEAQDKIIDSLAILILDRMSDVIGDLKSVSFKVNTEYDSIDHDLGFLKHHNQSEMYFSGADKMLVITTGEKGHRGMWYNGKQLAYYSFTNNHYGFMEAPPGNTIEAIDKVHDQYGVDIPASDFFYPTFTDDLIAHSDRIEYLGKTDLDGTDCFHIATRNKEMGVQQWIRDDAFNLPAKMVIVTFGNNPRQFEASYYDWKVNADIPDTIFDFVVPPTATRLTIMPAK